MFCPPAMLARIAERRPSSLDALERMIGPARTERFGAAFLAALADEPEG
jgi:hypothetical protein